MSKNQLRKTVIKERGDLAEKDVARKSSAVMRALVELEAYRRAGTIMAYVDFRNEVQTGELIKCAMDDGKRVAVPLTDLENKRLIPSLLADFPGDLAAGTYGILEPRDECLRPLEPGEMDMVVVPGVAFDEAGNRLGYGGGFYDRFLPRTRKECLWVAPAFELQLRDNVYPGAYDCPVHFIVTEDRVIDCRRNRAGASRHL